MLDIVLTAADKLTVMMQVNNGLHSCFHYRSSPHLPVGCPPKANNPGCLVLANSSNNRIVRLWDQIRFVLYRTVRNILKTLLTLFLVNQNQLRTIYLGSTLICLKYP